MWFFLAFKEQILGLINASTAAHAPDEVLPSALLYDITIAGSGDVTGNCDDTRDDSYNVIVDDLGLVILTINKLATCKAGVHTICKFFSCAGKMTTLILFLDEPNDGQGLIPCYDKLGICKTLLPNQAWLSSFLEHASQSRRATSCMQMSAPQP